MRYQALKRFWKNSRRGLTLLEIMIVVIIVSVLASLAFSKYGGVIERVRAQEALNTLGVIRNAMHLCYLGSRDYSRCLNVTFPDNGWGNLNLQNPNNLPNTHFNYGYGVNVSFYSVWAIRNDYELSTEDNGGPIGSICGNSGTPTDSQIFLCVENTGLSYIKGIGLYSHIDTTPQ